MTKSKGNDLAENLAAITGEVSKNEKRGFAGKLLGLGVLGTVCAGGIYMVMTLDNAPDKAPVIQPSDVTDFPEDDVSLPVPDAAIPPAPVMTQVVPDTSAQEEAMAALQKQIEDLQSALNAQQEASTTEQQRALTQLQEQMQKELEELRKASADAARDAEQRLEEARRSLEAEKNARRLEQQRYEMERLERLNRRNADTGLDGASEEELAAIEAERRRMERLEQLRSEREALQKARINSNMLALGGGTGAKEEASERAISERRNFVTSAGGPTKVSVAQHMARPDLTITQGTIIQAALETAIDSTLPGVIRAVVSEDVHSFDGSNILIPSGSKLFGEYQSDLRVGQARILVAWTRVVTPEGRSVSISSFGADDLGRSGTTGRVFNRFLQRFGSAAMISIIGATPMIAAGQTENDIARDVTKNIGEDFTDATGDVISQYLNMPPTVRVDQGQRITVILDRDVQLP